MRSAAALSLGLAVAMSIASGCIDSEPGPGSSDDDGSSYVGNSVVATYGVAPSVGPGYGGVGGAGGNSTGDGGFGQGGMGEGGSGEGGSSEGGSGEGGSGEGGSGEGGGMNGAA